MLPLFNACVNERAFKFSQACISISRASSTQIQAQKGARSLTDPLGAQTLTAYLIVKNTSDAIRFYRKTFEAKELLRIEAPWGTSNYELEHRR
jgi:hypothetical protein